MAAHDYLLGEYTTGKTLKLKGDAPTCVLDGIVISTNHREVDGRVELVLLEGSQCFASVFRYLILRSGRLDNLAGLVKVPWASDSDMAVST